MESSICYKLPTTNIPLAIQKLARSYVGIFGVSDVNVVISGALKLDQHKTIKLSEIINRKTHGNPFFVVQFLTILRDMGILDYSLSTTECEWAEDRVEEFFVTDNVLQEILRVKIGNLSPLECFLAQVAACFGTNFTHDLLFTGAQAVQNDCKDAYSYDLSKALIEECIGHMLSEGIFEQCWFDDDISSRNLRFAHDQIEAAAADLLPCEITWQWKAALAKAMLLSDYVQDSRWLYVIADLCNEGHSRQSRH